ncbi:MAG: methyltransferase family protein [Candidatus Accumulibacter regalis]
MALPGIEQAQLLSDIFADALAKFSPCSVAVIGCAGGNGFDRIPPAVSRVVGVDLNPLFVAETEARFRDRIEHLELIAGDIQSPEILFSPVDLIFLGLVLEYVDVDPVVAKMLSMLTPRGHMVTVLQLPSVGHQQVSPSPFKKVSALCRFLWNGRWFWQFEGAVMSRADVVRAQPNPLHRCPLAYACSGPRKAVCRPRHGGQWRPFLSRPVPHD